MVTITVSCRYCGNQDAVRRKGLSTNGHQRYRCEACQRSFQLEYVHRAHQPGIKEQVVDMALNGSGIRDTAASAVRPCAENKHEHGHEYAKKKATSLVSVNPAYLHTETTLCIRLEADEQWSYVQKKRKQRWLWWVENHDTGEIVAFLFGPVRRCGRTNASFKRLLRLLTESGIVVSRWFTDYWWAYHDLLPTQIHQAGKDQTQSIERKHLDLRTRIKRLARRTICFSKSVLMHDTVIGLLINHLFFRLNVHL